MLLEIFVSAQNKLTSANYSYVCIVFDFFLLLPYLCQIWTGEKPQNIKLPRLAPLLTIPTTVVVDTPVESSS